MTRSTKTIVAKALGFLKQNKLVVLLLLTAAFLRLYDLPGHATFLGDQGRDAIIIKRIVTLEHFPAIGAPTSIGQIYLGPFYYYLIAPFLLLWNFNPLGLSYGVLILTLLGIFASFLIIKKELSTETALLFLFLVAFSAVNIEMARFSWNPNLLPVFGFMTLCAFWYMLQKKSSYIVAFLVGILFSASLQLHFLAAFLAPTLGIFFLAALVREKYKMQLLFRAVYAVLGFILFSIPLIIYDMRHQFLNSRNFIKLFSEGNVVVANSYSTRLFETVTSFVTHITFPNIHPLVATAILIVFLLTCLLLLYKKPNGFFSLCFTTLVLFLCGFALLNSPRHPHYFGPIYFAAFVSVAYMLTRITSKTLKYAVIFTALGLYMYVNSLVFKQAFGQGSYQVAHAKRVAEFMAKKINNRPYNIATWPVEYSEDPYTYFLELQGLLPANRQKVEITKQMFVLCIKEPCRVLDSPSWNISMFGPAKIANIWNIEKLKIYKLVHTQTP